MCVIRSIIVGFWWEIRKYLWIYKHRQKFNANINIEMEELMEGWMNDQNGKNLYPLPYYISWANTRPVLRQGSLPNLCFNAPYYIYITTASRCAQEGAQCFIVLSHWSCTVPGKIPFFNQKVCSYFSYFYTKAICCGHSWQVPCIEASNEYP